VLTSFSFPSVGKVQASLRDVSRFADLPGAERAGLSSSAPPGRECMREWVVVENAHFGHYPR